MSDDTKYLDSKESKQIEIDFEGEKVPFKVRNLSWYEEENLSSEYISFDMKTNEMKIKSGEMNLKILKLCLVEAPFTLNDNNLTRIKKELKDKLLMEVMPSSLRKKLLEKTNAEKKVDEETKNSLPL